MASVRHWEQNKEATVYVGNLDERFNEALMWELMTQMGSVVNVHMPMDRVSRLHQGFGFVEFDTTESADYAARCLNGVRLYGKPIRVNKASADRQRATDIGAELFVNNLDPQVDEKILYDTFAQFGRLVAPPNVVRDQNNVSKGYGFVNFDSFEASDAARDAMHGQYLLSKQIVVEYAYKKDGRGERHGDEAERKLAAEGKKHNIVPEIQPLPPAFLMSRPAPMSNGVGGGLGLGLGLGPNGMPTPPMRTGANAVGPISGGAGALGSLGALPSRGPVPISAAGFHPSRQQQAPPGAYNGVPSIQQQQAPPVSLPPGFAANRPAGVPPALPSGAASGPPGGAVNYRAAPPVGLPARPPPGGPASGFRNGVPLPPGFAAGANNAAMVPPPGAPGAAGGYSNMPPPPPPAGFGRR